MAEIIFKYFPNLSADQKKKFLRLKEIYSHWNSKVNTISRKDFDHFYERHVLHSLGIAKFFSFDKESRVLDFGTGGGFPGIPLALLFPDVQFLLVDSIAKKIHVVNDVAKDLKMENLATQWTRVENISEQFDYITGRAVKEIPKILQWVEPLLDPKSEKNNSGIIYLKGGEFEEDLNRVGMQHSVNELKDVFNESFFETKKVIRFYL
ncbi:MAG: 16S rRNA (guanine(527)-N(7))-methyltransferase RsmG [Bacteroidota bacterium]